MANLPYTDKTEISHSDYLKLLGLMELARRNEEQGRSIVAAASELVGEKPQGGDYQGHAADECYGRNQSADALLGRLKIKVLPPEVAGA